MNIKLFSKAHYDLMSQFESLKPGRIDYEPKELWKTGHIYQDGMVNEMFMWFRLGVTYGLTINTIR